MIPFLCALAFALAALAAVVATGWGMSGAFLPEGPAFRLERAGWSVALGAAVLIAAVPLALAVGVWPRATLVVVAAAALAVARRHGLAAATGPAARGWNMPVLLLGLIGLGIAVYALRALTEPMWANDYVAIWGLKGKTMFAAGEYPERFYTWPGLAYSHPEYPLALPLLYAGLARLTGRWDDHAMALLFPLLQAATLSVLVGWLRRRGAAAVVAGLAAATVAWFEPLYSSFLTGMAEVPLAFGMLCFATALADSLDATDPGAIRRLVLASALAAATKNEGLFLAAAGCLLAVAVGKESRWKVAAAALVPGLAVRALHLPWRSRLPLADLDLRSFTPARVADALGAAGALLEPAAWAALVLVAALIVTGQRVPAGNRLLLLAAAALAAYLVVPAFAVKGPAWLVETTLRRTAAALVPLAAAGIAARFSGASNESERDPRASATSP
jgi:hypothetical protein